MCGKTTVCRQQFLYCRCIISVKSTSLEERCPCQATGRPGDKPLATEARRYGWVLPQHSTYRGVWRSHDMRKGFTRSFFKGVITSCLQADAAPMCTSSPLHPLSPFFSSCPTHLHCCWGPEPPHPAHNTAVKHKPSCISPLCSIHAIRLLQRFTSIFTNSLSAKLGAHTQKAFLEARQEEAAPRLSVFAVHRSI